jgi:hypothetical protein
MSVRTTACGEALMVRIAVEVRYSGIQFIELAAVAENSTNQGRASRGEKRMTSNSTDQIIFTNNTLKTDFQTGNHEFDLIGCVLIILA